MFDAALAALQNILSLHALTMLVAGVALGTCIGVIPGLGGIVGMAALLPFLWGMDPVAGLFLLLGMSAVTQTSDSFPSVLLGIPGTASAQATVMDGYPLAKRGEARRALGAAFSASMFGGIFGALVLFAIIPVARPLVLSLGSPELFMLALVGLSMVAIVSRGSLLLGLISAALGLMLATVGTATTTIEYRYTFDSLILRDGLSLVVITLGLFAVPEILKLLTQNRPVADSALDVQSSLFAGLRDTVKNWGLVLRSGAIGSAVGLVPGVGGSIVDWLTWGLAAKSRKNTLEFGQGEIRGVIAPESANNAKEGGSLVPTFLFGIPGSASTAVLLGGFVLLGIQPGPALIQGDGLVLVLSAVWALVLANILATTLCFSLTKWLAKLSRVPPRVLAPFILIVVVLASYHDAQHWSGVILLLVIGLLGWAMLTIGIPRPPLLIGFVLGPSVEQYLWLSVGRYGAEWLLFPGVITIGAILVAILVAGAVIKPPGAPRTREPFDRIDHGMSAPNSRHEAKDA